MEITELRAQRQQLSEKLFCYDGCECRESLPADAEAEERLLDLAADVMVQILLAEEQEG